MYACICVCMYVRICLCMNVCMYAGINVHELGILGWLRLVIAQNEEERYLTITTASWNVYLVLLNAEGTGNDSPQDQSCF